MARRGKVVGALGLALVGVTGLAASPARAQAPTTVDMDEHIFGASNTNAVAGHGGLTAGISGDGDLTVLSWPGPTWADQLAYIASNDLDVRSEAHLGATDGMGAFVGLLVTTGQGTQLAWLRDPAFAHAQQYTQPDAPVPRTTFTRGDLALTVVLTDVVSPDVDVLTRRVVVTRGAGSPVTAVSLVFYENLSPTLSRIPMIPFADWLLDAHNDFVAVYDRAAGVVVHVHPGDRAVIQGLLDVVTAPESVDYGPVDALMKQAAPADADVDALVAGLDSAFPPGIAALVTTEPPPASFQVGGDATPICASVGHFADNLESLTTAFPGLQLPLDPSIADAVRCTDPLPIVAKARGWTWAPEDALSDVADGQLSGSRLAACQTNAALAAPLVFLGDTAEGAALIAFGRSVAEARAALAKAQTQSAAARQVASEQAAHAALGSAALPDPSLGQRTVEVAERALVNIYVARDRSTGAVVASIARQPPYYLDWPRDGSFITQALDLAGLLPWGTQRGSWYVGLQRAELAQKNPILEPQTPTDPDTGDEGFPAYAWEMNYFSDGTVGGPIRWEIDNTALHIWAMVAHAAALQGADRGAFVGQVWPSLAQALHLLVRWRDPATGLPWPANEDDNLDLTSTLQGATAVYAALVAGARLGHAAGDEPTAQEALARAVELQQAILAAYYDPQSGLFRDTPQTGTGSVPGTAGSGATAWLAWPARVLDEDDPRLEAQLAADIGAVMPDIRGETEGGAYVMKNVVSAALLGRDGGSRDVAREAVQRLGDIATADTMQFGEVFVTTHPAGAGPVFSNRVAAPHVWEGTLFYLSAMALSSPASFDPQIAAMPLPPSPWSVAVKGGCREVPAGQGPWAPAGAAGLALAVTWRRLRRRRLTGSSTRCRP
jgi:hypothetical protein